MAIRPCCDSCREELEDYGAILLGPPDQARGVCLKRHLCDRCYQVLDALLNSPEGLRGLAQSS